MPLPTERSDLIKPLSALARRAGERIMAIYATDFEVRGKGDTSPVTEADEQAEAIILEGLRALTPDVPVVAEEAAEAGLTPRVGRRFWLVDPLDGTREFVRRNGEFTVNIALIEDGRSVLGVVFAPALDRLYTGGEGVGAFVEDGSGRFPIQARLPPEQGLTVVSSRAHTYPPALEEFLEGHKVARTVTAGSSLKLCLIAAGEADVYPRWGRTMEWDIAAGHALLSAAGGSVCLVNGRGALSYGKPKFENPHFIAWGRRHA